MMWRTWLAKAVAVAFSVAALGDTAGAGWMVGYARRTPGQWGPAAMACVLAAALIVIALVLVHLAWPKPAPRLDPRDDADLSRHERDVLAAEFWSIVADPRRFRTPDKET